LVWFSFWQRNCFAFCKNFDPTLIVNKLRKGEGIYSFLMMNSLWFLEKFKHEVPRPPFGINLLHPDFQCSKFMLFPKNNPHFWMRLSAVSWSSMHQARNNHKSKYVKNVPIFYFILRFQNKLKVPLYTQDSIKLE